MARAPGEVGLRWFGIAVLALVASLAPGIGCGGDAEVSSPTQMRGGSVATPMIEGPVTGGNGVPFIASTTFDLAQVGYSEAEFFICGTATAYSSAESLSNDGEWTVAPAGKAAYETRILVYRPIDRTKFNGTVVMEWLNVSGGLDAAPDWLSAHTEMIREGFAWVGVSAQYVGVAGGNSVLGLPVTALKKTDPERYGSLVHPGDSFSYDIFSQSAQAIRRPAGVSPLGNLKIGAVIAAGESQSAFRLVTYINAIHPLADIYDGFLVHSRGGFGISAAPLSERPQPVIWVPGTAAIRGDLNVPVLTLETETDLTFFSYFSARQADSDRFRLWEVAGTAHVDAYLFTVGGTDLGDSPDAAKLVVTSTSMPGFTCPVPINSGPQHFVLNAAMASLNRWVRQGTPPPHAPLLDVTDKGDIVRDTNGNALGGIRTPQVDVPIATLSGEGQSGSILCLLCGTTKPFDQATLAALYPDHSAYVSAFNAATDRAVNAGFILQHDAELMKAAASSDDVM